MNKQIRELATAGWVEIAGVYKNNGCRNVKNVYQLKIPKELAERSRKMYQTGGQDE